jgi:hypothetical protein
MKKFSAVEWFWQDVQDILPSSVDTETGIKLVRAYNQAKEIEKEQIINANIAGMEFIPVDPNWYQEDAEKYYNKTFKSE